MTLIPPTPEQWDRMLPHERAAYCRAWQTHTLTELQKQQKQDTRRTSGRRTWTLLWIFVFGPLVVVGVVLLSAIGPLLFG